MGKTTGEELETSDTVQLQPGSRDLQLLALAQRSPSPCQHSAHGMESCTFRAFPTSVSSV